MADALLLAAAALWLAAAILALAGVLGLSRVALAAGAVAGVAAAVAGLPNASETVTLPGRLAAEVVDFGIAPQGLWLMGFGLVPAIFACSLGSPDDRRRPRLAVRRRAEPHWRARRVRPSERRGRS